jgi:hypothetical protein
MGVGLMSLGHAYGSAGDDEARMAFLTAMHKMGATFWDDADMYADTEELVGVSVCPNLARSRRDVSEAIDGRFDTSIEVVHRQSGEEKRHLPHDQVWLCGPG